MIVMADHDTGKEEMALKLINAIRLFWFNLLKWSRIFININIRITLNTLTK